jgi:RNA polymerase sigma-70 factor (ECF subfamily)
MASVAPGLDRLLAQVAEGNEASFAELYQQSSSKLYGVALRILRSKDLAEDVVQDAYFKIWARAGDFNPAIAAPLTWMAAIVRNRALDELRRRSVRPAISDDQALEAIESGDEHPLDALERDEDVKRLFNCLDGLEAEKREIVRLAYLSGMTREALAAKFNRPEGTIKTWLHRSLAQLKGCLEA